MADSSESSSGGSGGDVKTLSVPSSTFFDDIKYYVSGTISDQATTLLKDGGAVKKSYLATSNTCLAGKGAEDNELEESVEIHEIPVVREEWVVYSVQCKQRLPLSCFQAPFGDDHAGQVFGHLNICLGGLTMKDKLSLWALIMSKGGNANLELNKQTTHLVVGAATTGPKYFEALKINQVSNDLNSDDKKDYIIKIVTPDWITKCIQQKRRLPERPFHPRLLTLSVQTFAQQTPINRVKPQHVQLPVGPSKHTTRITTPTPFQATVVPRKGPPNPLLLKQLQGGDTPSEYAKQGQLESPTVKFTKSSLPPPPTLPAFRASLMSSSNIPFQARKSAAPITGVEPKQPPTFAIEKIGMKNAGTIQDAGEISDLVPAQMNAPFVVAAALTEIIPDSSAEKETGITTTSTSTCNATKSTVLNMSTSSDSNKTVKITESESKLTLAPLTLQCPSAISERSTSHVSNTTTAVTESGKPESTTTALNINVTLGPPVVVSTASNLSEIIPNSSAKEQTGTTTNTSAIEATKFIVSNLSTNPDSNKTASIAEKDTVESRAKISESPNTQVSTLTAAVIGSVPLQSISTAENTNDTLALRTISTPSAASIRLPQTAVSMSPAPILAGQLQLPPASSATHEIGQRLIGPKVPIRMLPTNTRPNVPRMPAKRQPVFYGHDPNSVGKLPPEYCLLGCIFYIVDYPEDEEQKMYVRDWKKVIRQYGGEVEDAYHQRITHLMCKNQDSAISAQALRENKRLVTVYWLNDIVIRKKVAPPWRGIHFPLPANFDEPCKHMILTLTGFDGTDRDWVKDMIRMSGAEYTSHFSKHQNHAIICKSAEGPKYNKSKEWEVATVSVQWLNEVLFANVNGDQVMDNPKFQKFNLEDPFKIDYALVPNLIAAWKNPIGVTRETYQKFRDNPPRMKRKLAGQNEEDKGAKRMRLQEAHNRTISEPYVSKANETSTEIKTEIGECATRENANPNGQVPNIASIKDGKMDENENHSIIIEEISSDDARIKIPSILFTGFVASSLSEMERMARDLGANVVTCENASEATHMVMPKLGRTLAFLCGITYVKYIVSSTWIQESHKETKFLDEQKYTLEDESFDDKFGCNTRMTLFKKNRDKLFQGRIFYLTPSIFPSWKKLKTVIEAAGGKVENRRRKDIEEIKALNKPGQDPMYIIVACEHDLHIVADVLMAKIGIYNTEFVMSAIMRSKMDFDLTKSLTTV